MQPLQKVACLACFGLIVSRSQASVLPLDQRSVDEKRENHDLFGLSFCQNYPIRASITVLRARWKKPSTRARLPHVQGIIHICSVGTIYTYLKKKPRMNILPKLSQQRIVFC